MLGSNDEGVKSAAKHLSPFFEQSETFDYKKEPESFEQYAMMCLLMDRSEIFSLGSISMPGMIG